MLGQYVARLHFRYISFVFLSVVRIPPIFVSVISVVVFAVLLFVYNTIGRAKLWSRLPLEQYLIPFPLCNRANTAYIEVRFVSGTCMHMSTHVHGCVAKAPNDVTIVVVVVGQPGV